MGEVQGKNLTLVNSNAITGDGIAFLRANTNAPFHSGTSLNFAFWIKTTATAEKCVISQCNSVSTRSFFVTLTATGQLRNYTSADGTSWETFQTGSTALNDGNWHFVEYSWDAISGTILKIDGIEDTLSGSAPTSIHDSGSYFEVFRGIASYVFIGSMAGLVVNGYTFPLAEGDGTKCYEINNNAVLNGTGITLPAFRAELQNNYHYSIKNGFDEYKDGSGNTLRVPIGSTVTEAGWTFVVTHEAGKLHNRAETEMLLPADSTLETICSGLTNNFFYSAPSTPTPFHPDDFADEVDLEQLHQIYACNYAQGLKALLFYSATKTAEEDLKIMKCFVKLSNRAIQILTTEDGQPLLYEDGYVRIEEV